MFERYEGKIDLELFLKEKYGYTYTNDIDLSKQDFVEFEGVGAFALMWFKDDDDRYLFKISTNNLGELVSMKIAKVLNIPCAEYRLAKLGDKEGILSKKFTKESENILLGGHIIQEVLNNYPYLENKNNQVYEDKGFIELYNIPEKILKLDSNNKVKYFLNNLNNLEELTAILYNFYKNENVKDINALMGSSMFYLINLFIFDILTIQADRHVSNWGIGKRKDESYFMIPIYDNNASYDLWHDELDQRIDAFNALKNSYDEYPNNKKLVELKNFIYKNKPLLSVSEDDILNPTNRKRTNNLEMLDIFLSKSSYDYIQLIDIYLTCLEDCSIENILQEIEKDNKIELSNKVKKYVSDIFGLNLKFCREVANKHIKREAVDYVPKRIY